MRNKKIPILLSFYALSNGSETLLFGQITYTKLQDLSFKAYSRRRTFRTLLSLYRTKPYSNQEIILGFDHDQVKVETNRHGAFYEKVSLDLRGCTLQKIVLVDGGAVKLIDGLYQYHVNYIKAAHVVISDIDDTLVHSFITKKVKKFRTLMFTTMEKRKAVENMQHLLKNFTALGAVPVYLSNSEQNLYPLIYRFLLHNDFPHGPLFLKQIRRLKDVLLNIKFPPRNTHKINTIKELIHFFHDKKFILMGDNTQQDLNIYLEAAANFTSSIKCIIIRKVVDKKSDAAAIHKAAEELKASNIRIYYADTFPTSFKL